VNHAGSLSRVSWSASASAAARLAVNSAARLAAGHGPSAIVHSPGVPPNSNLDRPGCSTECRLLSNNTRRIADLQGQIEELNAANRKLAIQADHNQNIEPQLARFRESEPELKRLRVQVDELNLRVINLKDRIKDANLESELKVSKL
jgi:TolA-binding protein